MGELVNVDRASAALGVNRYSLYRWAKEGKAPSYRAGRALRFDIDELRAWMKEQAQVENAHGE